MKTLRLFLVPFLLAITAWAQEPLEATQVGSGDGACRAPKILGDLCVTGAGRRLVVLDYSDPDHPTPLASVAVPGEILNLALCDSLACVVVKTGFSNHNPVLHLIDLRSPAEPARRGTWPITGQFRGMAANGSTLYLVHGTSGVKTLDLRNPDLPSESAYYACYAQTLTCTASRLYVVTADWHVQILSLADPLSPEWVASMDPDFAPGFTSIALAAQDTLLVLGTTTGVLQAFDVSDPAAPVILGGFPPVATIQFLRFSGTRLHVHTSTGGHLRFDLGNPAAPTVVDTLAIGYNRGLAVSGDLLFTAELTDGLRCFDQSVPGAPQERGRVPYLASAFSLAVSGSLAVTSSGMNLHVHDLADPEYSRWLGYYPMSAFAEALIVHGNFVYGDCGEAGLRIVDISDPEHPLEVAADSSAFVYSMALEGERLYLTGPDRQLRVLNLQDPVHPVLLGSITTEVDLFLATAIQDGLLVGSGINEDIREVIQILDVSGPSAPVTLASILGGYGDYAEAMLLHDGLLYKSDTDLTLRILDLRDPETPLWLGSLGFYHHATALHMVNQALVVGDREGLHKVIDVRDPQNPGLVGVAHGADYSSGVAIHNRYLVASSLNEGLGIFDFPGLFLPAPTDLSIGITGPNVRLQWTDPGTGPWNVYRLTSPLEDIGPENRVATVSVPAWTDTQALGRGAAFYRVTAVVE